MGTETIEARWREYLRAYSDPQIRDRLQSNWRDDPNVVKGRIQFAYPLTFQPGYIGTRFFESYTRILFTSRLVSVPSEDSP